MWSFKEQLHTRSQCCGVDPSVRWKVSAWSHPKSHLGVVRCELSFLSPHRSQKEHVVTKRWQLLWCSLWWITEQVSRVCWSLALTMTPLRQVVISVLATDYAGQSLKGNSPQFGNKLTHQSLFTGLCGKILLHMWEKKKKKRLLFYNSRGSGVKFESQCDKKNCGNAEPKRSEHAGIIELTWHLWLRLATRGCVSCY